MNGKLAKLLRRSIYGDHSQRGGRQQVWEGKQIVNQGLRRHYQIAKVQFQAVRRGTTAYSYDLAGRKRRLKRKAARARRREVERQRRQEWLEYQAQLPREDA